MKFKKIFWIIFFTVAWSGPVSSAKVAHVALKDLVKKSDSIVIGRVVKITRLDGVSIAELEINQTIKGDSRLKRLHYWATPTWTCDISTANEGETVLLLLTRAKEDFLSNSSEYAKNGPLFVKHLREYLQNSPLFFINWSGGGRMIVTKTVVERNDYIIYPDEIKIVERRPLQYGYRRFSLLEDVVRFIQKQLR